MGKFTLVLVDCNGLQSIEGDTRFSRNLAQAVRRSHEIVYGDTNLALPAQGVSAQAAFAHAVCTQDAMLTSIVAATGMKAVAHAVLSTPAKTPGSAVPEVLERWARMRGLRLQPSRPASHAAAPKASIGARFAKAVDLASTASLADHVAAVLVYESGLHEIEQTADVGSRLVQAIRLQASLHPGEQAVDNDEAFETVEVTGHANPIMVCSVHHRQQCAVLRMGGYVARPVALVPDDGRMLDEVGLMEAWASRLGLSLHAGTQAAA